MPSVAKAKPQKEIPEGTSSATGRSRFSDSGSLTVGILLAAGLLVAAFLIYGEHLRDGYWVGDAWTTRAWYALYPHTDFFSTVGHFFDLNSMNARPANAVYHVALNDLLGADTEAWYGWQLLSCVAMCMCVYGLLRELRIALLDAVSITILLLTFPASLALWFWSPIVQASAAISFGAVGFILALRAFRARGSLKWALHAASLLLFGISTLLYEVCLPIFLGSILVYLLQAPRRQALLRWAADLAVLVPIVVLVSAGNAAKDQSVSGAISHGWEMAGEIPTFVFGRLLPFGSARPIAAMVLLVIVLLGLWAWRRSSLPLAAKARLRFLLFLGGAGFLLAVLAYLLYVPALDYYHPLGRGIADRVNALAGIGWILFLYAAIALAVTLLALVLRLPSAFGRLASMVLVVLLFVSWIGDVEGESRAYITAGTEGERVLNVIKRAVPDPDEEAAIWAFGQPVEVSAGIPLFANYWNMTAAVALSYHEPRLRSFVALPGTRFHCTAEGVVPTGAEYTAPRAGTLGEFGSAYGKTYFVDTVHGQYVLIGSQAQCERVRESYALSPPSAAGP